MVRVIVPFEAVYSSGIDPADARFGV